MANKLKKQHDPAETVTYWLDEIKASRKRHENYRKVGKEVFEIYEADKEQDRETPFNILYSNTETLRPALFSAQPRPVVERRFKDDDALGKFAAQAGKRALEFHLDTNREGYETVTEAMGACVLDAILPGRGMVQVKYDADFRTFPSEQHPPEEDTTKSASKNEEPVEYAEKEQVCVESVVWDRVHIGPAKKWHKVPWIAYEFFLTKEEVKTLAGEAVANKLAYLAAEESADDQDGRRKAKEDGRDVGGRKTARVYQIWDKTGGKKILYVSDSYKEGLLKDPEDDPLKLTGFFNTPRPLMFVEKSCSLIPTAPYAMYKKQARELNRITKRIEKLVEAIKARGLYDGALGENLKAIMSQDDNALVVADVASSMATEKGFQNAIWMLPIDIMVAVLQQLYQARESCKQTIYEITGISDIIRGATQASETATAQTIKNQWGTLRLKRMQEEVARYVRDLLRMVLEISADKFSEETWAEMTGLPFLTSTQQQQLQAQAQAMAQMQPPGAPPDPQMAAIQQELSKPVWAKVLKILKDDVMRTYRIDIETNSTVQPEAAEDQKAIMEMMGAIGQVMQSLAPLVTSGALDFNAAKALLLFIARRFRFGSEIEDYIQAMQAPKPQDDGGAEQMKQAQKQMEMDKQLAVKEIDYKKKEADMELKAQAMQKEMELKQREMDIEYREMQLQMKEQHFGMQQEVERGLFDIQKQSAVESIGNQSKMAQLENKKYKTENVVNAKADTALGQGVGAMKGLVEQLTQMVAKQAQDNQRMLQEITSTMSKPRVKKAVRGKDGRIEAVEEVLA